MLKEIRQKQGITQIELSKALNVQQSTVSMWETGASKPPLDKVSALAQALHVSELQILQCFHKGAIRK